MTKEMIGWTKQGLKRDDLAMSAMHGMLAHATRYRPRDPNQTDWHVAMAEEAYEIADAMINLSHRET